MSNSEVKILPELDKNGTLLVQDKDANNLLKIDSDNKIIRVGKNQQHIATQYAHFGIDASSSDTFGTGDTYHYTIPFNGGYQNTAAAQWVQLGTGTDPDLSETNTLKAMAIAQCVWHVHDAIVIDKVSFWLGADGSGDDNIVCHLVSYDIDTSNTSTGGDLSNGVILADGGIIASDGYAQAYYQDMTIQSSDVGSNKGVFFTFQQDGTNANYAVNATIKYHLE